MYKHGNGRLQMRSGNGQFRQSDLSDLGLGSAICPNCGAINAYKLYEYRRDGGFVERVRNEPPTVCESCKEPITTNAG